MRIPAAEPRPYELLMLGLSVYVLAALAAEAFLPLTAGTRTLLDYADFAICIVFLAEFFFNLARAEDRRAFLKWGWIDLVSSIPLLDAARGGQAVRVVRIVRVLRGCRSLKRLGTYLLRRRSETTLSAAVLLVVLLVVGSSIMILELEAAHPDAGIRTPGDALWWAVTTITTVGYGDRVPVTAEGRVLAALLMTIGVGVFGVYTGLVASWYLAPAKPRPDELAEIRIQLDAVMRALESIRIRQEEPAVPPISSRPVSSSHQRLSRSASDAR